jgi:CheY-like chemotaxis protein
MYAEKFTIDGFFTVVVHDGESALEAMKTKSPDCVLLDLHIPKIDGLAVVAKAKAEMGALPPILALTNIAERDRKEKALALGVREYLIKAMLTPEQVVQKVKQVLS